MKFLVLENAPVSHLDMQLYLFRIRSQLQAFLLATLTTLEFH